MVAKLLDLPRRREFNGTTWGDAKALPTRFLSSTSTVGQWKTFMDIDFYFAKRRSQFETGIRVAFEATFYATAIGYVDLAITTTGVENDAYCGRRYFNAVNDRRYIAVEATFLGAPGGDIDANDWYCPMWSTQGAGCAVAATTDDWCSMSVEEFWL